MLKMMKQFSKIHETVYFSPGIESETLPQLEVCDIF